MKAYGRGVAVPRPLAGEGKAKPCPYPRAEPAWLKRDADVTRRTDATQSRPYLEAVEAWNGDSTE
jgi:hypothetical protein